MASDAAQRQRHGQHVRSCIARLTVRTKVWLEIDGRFVIGEHGIELLRAIDRQGSLAGAARSIGWSYRHAWGYLRRAEQRLGGPLVITRSGKGAARGATLLPLAREVMRVGVRR